MGSSGWARTVRGALVGSLAALSLVSSAEATPRLLARLDGPSAEYGPGPLTPTAWFGAALEGKQRYELGSSSLLARYRDPELERAPWSPRIFWSGDYGFKRWQRWASLAMQPGACAPPEVLREPLASYSAAPFAGAPDLRGFLARFGKRLAAPELVPLEADGLDVLPTWLLDQPLPPEPLYLDVEASEPCAPWKQPRPVTIARYGAEQDTFTLTECDGSVSSEAVDRLSILARPVGVARPELPLPPEPDETAPNGEWVPGIKLVHPRLVWALQQISAAFPWKRIYLMSGYRPEAGTSRHAHGRALDLFIMGVPNERVLAVCRKLEDIGCGYYPNNLFVHVDVRPRGSKHPLWVDTARPGEPSRYVDSWPGIIEGGALADAGEI
jgi:hypothetical protein